MSHDFDSAHGGILKTKAVSVLIRLPLPIRLTLKRSRVPIRFLKICWLLVLVSLLGPASGCNRFRHQQYDTAYVAARQMYLHDRIAAVSERVAMVVNGQKLQVLDRNRRFLKVKTEKNEIGWIEARGVIDSQTYQEFMKLAEDHKQDPQASTATVRDDLYMHVAPGRSSEHFYLLPGNAKVELLARASAPKVSSSGTATPRPAVATATQSGKSQTAATQAPAKAQPGEDQPPEPQSEQVEAAPPPAMEDWWLARDSQGHVGWLLANRLYVDVPDEIAEYGEGQRFIGSWMLTKVTDPAATTPDHQKPEYLAVMSTNKSGLPYDFDQVRVFTWSLRHQRYETAFRLRPIQGYLPVQVTTQPTPRGPVPAFSFQIAGSQDIVTDPATGITRPANPRTINYQLIDTLVKRVGPDIAPISITHDTDKKSKTGQKTAKKKHKK